MNPIKEMVINLDRVLTDNAGKPLFIQNIVTPEQFKIDRNKHFQEGIIRNGFALARA
jgi:hypothetical protein